MDINQSLHSVVAGLMENLQSEVQQKIQQEIAQRIASLDIKLIVNDVVASKLQSLITLHDFPERSIAHTSINFDKFAMSGDYIKGGIIEKFGSTGIEDLATAVRMTLMDHAVAFEGPVFAPSAAIKGDLTVDGNLIVKGEVPSDSAMFTKLKAAAAIEVRELLNEELFSKYSDIIYNKIATAGVDLDKITQGGRDVVKGPQLGYHIVDSNLQRVGVVKDLQTSGENLLSETLYVSNRRVGVNTLDPSAALSVWDEEVELVIAKRKQDVGFIGTQRRQNLVLGSNSKENIRLDIDGNTQIDNLTVGKVPMSSAAVVPNYSGTAGQVVWNEQPSLGGPMGWVCLGATRWANFGIID